MPNFVWENLERLTNERRNKNLTRKMLSQLTGVSQHALGNYENELYSKKKLQYPTILNYNKLAKFFGWQKVDIPPEEEKKAKIREEYKKNQATKTETEDTFKFPDEKPLPIKPKFKFLVGEKYSIADTKSKLIEGDEQILIYIGKTGRHHQFKNMRGGWGITFTDNQLIGKFITGGEFHDNRTPWNKRTL